MEIIDLKLQFVPNRLTYGNTPKVGFLHHSGGIRTVLEYHQQHLDQGWAGLGYHYAVDLDGKIYIGRPIDCVPAGITGFNTNTVHVMAIGNFENMVMPDVQKESIKELVQYCKDTYGIEFKGHKEVASTDCPGKNYPLSEIKLCASNSVTAPTNPIHNKIFKLQHALNILGITDSNGNSLIEDGWIGSKTLSALSKRQAVVRRGDVNILVGWIQEVLNITSDNCYGNSPYFETYNAILNFQRNNGLDDDGIVGPNTWAALVK
jgi:hypothetical protein